MDNIQFWLYLVFGLIYFVSRFLKKKKGAEQEAEANPDAPTTTGRPQKTLTFEELLKEFTQETVDEPEPFEEVKEKKAIVSAKPALPKEPVFEEGKTRRFSDEESKRVYEESVKRAEGFDLEFKPDEHFKSSIKSRVEMEEEQETFADEIRNGLQNSSEAKKAVLYAEIFNRKY